MRSLAEVRRQPLLSFCNATVGNIGHPAAFHGGKQPKSAHLVEQNSEFVLIESVVVLRYATMD